MRHTDTLIGRRGPEKTRSTGENASRELTVNVFLAYGAPGVRSSSEVTGLFNTGRQTQFQGANPAEPQIIHSADISLKAS